jgi:hypothetical protein
LQNEKRVCHASVTERNCTETSWRKVILNAPDAARITDHPAASKRRRTLISSSFGKASLWARMVAETTASVYSITAGRCEQSEAGSGRTIDGLESRTEQGVDPL